MNLKKNFVLLMTVIIGGLAFTACNDNDDDYTPNPQSFVQLVNSYSYADAGLGFKFGQTSLNPNQPLKYGDNFVYLVLQPGKYNVSAGVSGTETSILDTSITFSDTTYYTTVIYGSEAFPTSITVEDKQPSDFDQSKANVRFFNLAENTVPLNVNLIGSGEPMEGVFTNRDADDQTSAKQNQVFKSLTTGVYTIQLTDASGAEVASTTETVDVRAGGYYTIIAQGVKDDAENPLKIQLVDHFPQQ